MSDILFWHSKWYKTLLAWHAFQEKKKEERRAMEMYTDPVAQNKYLRSNWANGV